jgi:hypothetical protein
MSCRVDERVAVRNLERIGNELRAVIGLRESKIFAYKVSVRRNFSAVDFRVVGRNEQNWHDPQPALQCQRRGDFARYKSAGKQRKYRQVEPESKRKSAAATRHRPCPSIPHLCTHRTAKQRDDSAPPSGTMNVRRLMSNTGFPPQVA